MNVIQKNTAAAATALQGVPLEQAVGLLKSWKKLEGAMTYEQLSKVAKGLSCEQRSALEKLVTSEGEQLAKKRWRQEMAGSGFFAAVGTLGGVGACSLALEEIARPGAMGAVSAVFALIFGASALFSAGLWIQGWRTSRATRSLDWLFEALFFSQLHGLSREQLNQLYLQLRQPCPASARRIRLLTERQFGRVDPYLLTHDSDRASQIFAQTCVLALTSPSNAAEAGHEL